MSQVPTGSSAGTIAAPRPGGQTVAVPRPEQGADVTVQSSPGGRLDFGFDPGEATASRPENSNDLVFDVEGGGKVTISGFFEVGDESLPTLSLPDGVEVAAADFFAGSDMDMTTAAGPGRASGSGTSYDDDAGSLLDGLGMYGKLGTDQWERGTENAVEIQGIEVPGGTFSFSVATGGTDVPDDGRPGAVPGGSYAGIFEDWQPNQHLDGDAAVVTPARLEMSFTPTGSTVVDTMALSGFTVGSEIYIGDPNVVAPIVITTPGQVVNLTPGQIDAGVYIKPPLNDDTDMNISAQVTLRATSSGQTEVVDGSFTIIVDAAADRPEDVQGVADDTQYAGVHVDMDADAVKSDEAGWKKTEFDAGHDEAVSVEIPVTLTATFSDFDGSETHTLYIAVPEPADGWTAIGPNGQPLAVVDNVPGHEGQAFFAVPEGQITFDAAGNAQAELVFRHEADNLAGSDTPSEPLTVVAVARETPTDGELVDVNNTAFTASEDQVSLIVNNINAGLSIQAGWGSEDADDAKHLAGGGYAYEGAEKDATDDGSAPVLISITDNGSDYISSVTLTWAPEDGALTYSGAGTAVYDAGKVTITFAPGQAMTDLGDNLRFTPAADTDSTDAGLHYEVVVNNGTGAEAVYTGNTTVVIDAVADRGETGAVTADYIEHDVLENAGAFAATAAAPGDVVNVSGSVSFNGPEDSELHYAVVSVPNAAWSIAGLEQNQLLDAGAVQDLWKAQGDIPDVAAANAAVEGAINAGPAGPYLLIEADSASGAITIYVDDGAGNAVALAPGHALYDNIDYDAATGQLTWTVPVQTPDTPADSDLTISSWGVSLEKDPVDGEYDYANNISAGDVQDVPVYVDAITGSLNINPALLGEGALHEDNQPNQWTNAAGDTIVTDGSGPDTTGGLPGYDPQYGIALFALEPRGSEDIASEYVKSITFEALPAASEGTLFYNGVEVSETTFPGLVITDPSGVVDLAGLTFKPADDYSGDVNLNYSAELASHSTGQVVNQDEAPLIVHVESVADLPVNVTASAGAVDYATVEVTDTDDAVIQNQITDGWNTTVFEAATSETVTVDVPVTLNATFDDFDGSESHTLYIAVPQPADGWTALGPDGQPLAVVDNVPGHDGQAFYAVPEGQITFDAAGNATVDLTLRHESPDLASSDITSAPLTVVAVARETSAGDLDQTNNTAVSVSTDTITLDLNNINAGLTIQAGWGSEGADDSKHLASDTPVSHPHECTGAEAGATDDGSAPIRIAIDGDTDDFIASVTLTWDTDDGTLSYNGVEYTGGSAVITLGPGTTTLGDGLRFIPAADTDSTDVNLGYSVVVNNGAGAEAVYKGGTTVVIDAVADRGVTGDVTADYIEHGVLENAGEFAATAAAPGDVVNVSGSVDFNDQDGSELHYAVISVPDAAWSIAGLPLLGGDAVKALWKGNAYGDNAVKSDENEAEVDGALADAIPAGQDGPFLLIEADSATGAITIYAADSAGNAVALDPVDYADLYAGITYDKDSGALNWTVPVQTPDLAEDGSLEIASWGVSVEKTPGDGEYDYANNISAGDVKTAVVEVDVITGSLNINPDLTNIGLYEDNQPKQWTDADGNAIVAEGVPADSTPGLAAGPNGVPLFALQGGSDSEYVKSVTFAALPEASEGTLFYNGVEVNESNFPGLVITDPSGVVDLAGLTFKPTENYSGNVAITYTAELASSASGQVVQDGDTITVHVESVADLADAAITEVTQDTVQGDFFDVQAAKGEAEAAPDGSEAQYTGWYVSHADNETPVSATLDLTTTLNDLDGSEHAQILVLVGTGTDADDFAGNGINVAGHMDNLVFIDGNAYAVFAEGEAGALMNESGGKFELPLLVDYGQRAPVHVIVRTEETDTAMAGNQTDNDVAMREVVSQELPLSWLSAGMDIRTGWVSEGQDNAKYLESGTHAFDGGGGFDAASTKTNEGAPVSVKFDNPGSIDGITFTYKASDGQLLVDGQPIAGIREYTENGVTYCEVIIPNNPAQSIYNPFNYLQGGRLTFKPADGFSDADISLNYQVEVNEGSHKFLVHGETTVVVDAVADHANITGGDAKMDTADDAAAGAVVVAVDAVFADKDGSETHYVLVEAKEGWTCTDAGAKLVTVYFDANGQAIAPTWNPETQSYDEPTSGTSSKEFFRIEVTGDAGGSYQVHLTPPAGAEDVTLTTGTLAVEQVDYAGGADGKVNEYDYSNNHAYDFDSVTVDLLNSGLTAGATAAYEDHDKDVSTNYTGYEGYQEAGDGVITLSISGGGEILDTADGKNFTLTFDFPADATPGSFTVGNTIFSAPDNPSFNSETGHWELTVPANSLGGAYNSNAGTVSLRYKPPANDDTDLSNLHFSVPVKAGDSGFTADLEADLSVLVVDAVADKPASATIAADYEGVQEAAKPGEEITLNLNAKFSDFDGSEEHSVIVELPAGFGTPSDARGALTALSAERIAELNARGADPALDPGKTYYEIDVLNNAVDGNGSVNISLTVTAPSNADAIASTGSGDKSYPVKVIAHSHETATGATESTLDNNNAFTTNTANVVVGAVVDDEHNPFQTVTVVNAYEDHLPNQHTGSPIQDATSGVISLKHDASDQVDTLVLTCSKEQAGEGYLTYKGQPASTDPNADFSVREVDGKLEYTIKGYDQNSVLRFNPGPDSDGDVKFEWTADVHDTDSGYSAVGTEDWTGEFTVKVDAVADKPVGAAVGSPTYTDLDGDKHDHTDINAGGSGVPGGSVAFTVSASFGDYADGSENQYLVVQRTNANWKAEGSDGLLATGGITYFQYDVTGEIDAAAAFENGNSVPGFTVVLNADGSYTVSSDGSPDVNVSFSGGKANVSLTAELDIPDDYATKTTTINAGGVSIDRGTVNPSNGAISIPPDGEIITGNNVAVSTGSVQVILGTIESKPVVSVSGFVFENGNTFDDANAHLSELTAANNEPHGQDWNDGRTIEDEKIAQAGATIHVEGIASGETGYLTLSFSATEPNGSPTDLSGATVSFDGQTYILVEDPNNAGSYTTAKAVEDLDNPGSFIPDGGPVPIPVGSTGSAGADLTFTPAPNNSGIDIAVKADVTVEDVNSGREQTFDPVDAGTIEVDAVAQAADVEVEMEQVRHTSDVIVHGEVTFQDFEDGSEDHYILVEAITGIGKPSYIILHDGQGNEVRIDLQNIGWEPVDSIGLFWRIPLDNDVIAQYDGKLSVDVGFHDIAYWRYGAGINMRFGAVSEERVEAMDGERFHSGTPGDNNNVAHVIDPDVIHVIVPGSGTGGGGAPLMEMEVYEDGEPNSHIGDHAKEPIVIDLEDPRLDGITGQIRGGHEGDTIEYQGTTYTWNKAEDGFADTDGNILKWQDIGTDDKIVFTLREQDDTDRSLQADQGHIWIKVDAVADRPVVERTSYIDEVRPDGEHYAAALSEGKVIAATELHFDDTDGSETHYAVLQKHPQWKLDSLRVTMDLDGDGVEAVYTWTPNGWTDSDGNPLPDIGATVTTVFGSDGTPYYAVQLPDSVEDAKVEFIINAPKTDADLSQNLKIGGIARENATGAVDVELTFENNWAEDVQDVIVSVAMVETEALTVEARGDLTEDDTVNGITLHFDGFADSDGAVDSTYAGDNPERITSIDFVISQDGSGSGVQIGTIWYDGVEYPVTVGANGTAEVPIDFGDAGYDESKFSFVMAAGNHNGEDVTIEATPTVTDVDSGDEAKLEPVKVTVNPIDIADEATNVAVGAVDHNTNLAGIQDYAQPDGTISFTVSAQFPDMSSSFPDMDGSENHYILVEAKPGWTCNNSGATTIYLNDQGVKVDENAGGTRYFQIQVTDYAKSSVTVNLKVPSYTEDMLDEDGKAIALNVGAMAVEMDGGDYAVHFDTGSDADTVKVQIGAVQAEGVAFNADNSTDVYEDGYHYNDEGVKVYDDVPGAKLTISITGGTGYDADAAHEELTSLTINLQGGKLVEVDADGNVVVVSTNGILNTPELIDKALNGELYYQPAANVGGVITLNYSAEIKDVNSGATKTASGSDTVTVIAVTDAPADVSHTGTALSPGVGHVGTATINLQADFTGGDLDGSENHFILLALPQTALDNMDKIDPNWAPAGWVRLAAGDPKAGGLDGDDTVVFARDLASNVAQPGASFPGLVLDDHYDGEFTYAAGSKDGNDVYRFEYADGPVALTTGDINVAPDVPDDYAALGDILRTDTSTGGYLKNMTDADYDDVDVTGVSSQFNPDATVIEDDYTLTVEGKYGTLIIVKETGEYTYTLKDEYQGEGGVGLNGKTDKFTVDVVDEPGSHGTPLVDTAVITVTLGAPNTAPTANAERLEVGGGNETDNPALTDSGNLDLKDSNFYTDENGVKHYDDVTITPDAGWTPLDDGSGWQIDGKYGTLTLKTDGSYTYELTNEHVSGEEQFTVEFADKFGLAGQPAVITVNVAAVNHAPVVEAAEMHLTSQAKGMWMGNVKQHYSDSDALAGNQGDVLVAALTALDASGELRTIEVPASGSVSMELQHGTLTVLASGQYTYVAHDQAGAHTQDVWDSVTLTVTDSGGLSSSGSLNFALGEPAGPAPQALVGTDAAESLAGTADADVIYGGAGDDAIGGGAGNDTLSGGAGNDVIDGGDGNDVIYGGAGDDSIDGGAGNDVIRGGEGSDTIYGGGGDDTIYVVSADGGVVSGGAGDDLLIVEPGHGATEFLWKGEDVGGYHDTIRGFDVGNDTINLSDIIGEPAEIGSLLDNAAWDGGTLTVNGSHGSLTAAAADDNTLVLTLNANNGDAQTITIEASSDAFASFNVDNADVAIELLKQMIKDG